MTILSRNVTNFYLDEPEYGLPIFAVKPLALAMGI